MTVSVVILTYNAERHISDLLDRLAKQTISFDLVIIDSSSKDRTTEILKERKVEYISIPQSQFNHGSTRNLALDYTRGDIVVYLTQDALPDDEKTIENIVQAIAQSEKIAIAYGKQLPYPDSTTISSFARSANYPDTSREKNKSMIPQLGIKTCHCSNSFAAYRVSILKELGSFPVHCIMCEDVFVGARAILAGYSIYYSAESRVLHSHNYTLAEEFKRYFDVGVFYNGESWILDNFSRAEGEGVKFIINEMKYVVRQGKMYLIPEIILRTFGKYLGYLLGKYEKRLSTSFKRKISMHKYFWKEPEQIKTQA